MKNRFLICLLFLLPGMIISLYAQSDTVFNQIDARGLKQGYWKKHYPNGKLMYKGLFRDNKPVGEMRRYYESGALKVIMVFTCEDDYARSVLYYENGDPAAKGNYSGTKKDSTWEYYSYYDHSVKARETYNNGIKNGFSYHYYPDGTVSEKLEWKDNKKHGLWEQYFSNGAIMTKGFYTEGKLNGPFIVIGEDGVLSVKGNFHNNLRHDKWVFYKENGTVDLEITYNHGNPDDEDKLTEKQKNILRMIDENQGKYNEPDETNFLQNFNP